MRCYRRNQNQAPMVAIVASVAAIINGVLYLLRRVGWASSKRCRSVFSRASLVRSDNRNLCCGVSSMSWVCWCLAGWRNYSLTVSGWVARVALVGVSVLMCGASVAAVGRVSTSAGTFGVASSQCADVLDGFDRLLYAKWPGSYRASGCSSDIVVVGTVLSFLYSGGVEYTLPVTAITASAPAVPGWFSDWLAGVVKPTWYSSSAPPWYVGGSGGGVDVAQIICVPAAVTGAPCQAGFAPWSPVVANPVPFDYAYAGSIFAFFFCFTVALWWVSKSAGLILQAIRRF